MKYLALWSLRLFFFFENFVKPSPAPLPTYLLHTYFRRFQLNIFLVSYPSWPTLNELITMMTTIFREVIRASYLNLFYFAYNAISSISENEKRSNEILLDKLTEMCQ